MRLPLVPMMVLLQMLALFAVDGSALAQEPAMGRPKNHLTLTAGRWADTDLPGLPGKLLTGSLRFEESHYAALTYGRTLLPDLEIPLPFTGRRLHAWALEAESSLLKHGGLQSHWEATCALVLRTRPFQPLAALGWTFAAGWGGSYAFERPALEKGPNGEPGEDSRQFQSYTVFELDLFHPRHDRLHLVTRLHHRSGVFGLISPRKTGSNFLAAGLRVDF